MIKTSFTVGIVQVLGELAHAQSLRIPIQLKDFTSPVTQLHKLQALEDDQFVLSSDTYQAYTAEIYFNENENNYGSSKFIIDTADMQLSTTSTECITCYEHYYDQSNQGNSVIVNNKESVTISEDGTEMTGYLVKDEVCIRSQVTDTDIQMACADEVEFLVITKEDFHNVLYDGILGLAPPSSGNESFSFIN